MICRNDIIFCDDHHNYDFNFVNSDLDYFKINNTDVSGFKWLTTTILSMILTQKLTRKLLTTTIWTTTTTVNFHDGYGITLMKHFDDNGILNHIREITNNVTCLKLDKNIPTNRDIWWYIPSILFYKTSLMLIHIEHSNYLVISILIIKKITTISIPLKSSKILTSL